MTTFKHFVQNLSDADVATLIVKRLIRSLGDSHIDVEFDDDIADLGERTQSAVLHLTLGETEFFAVLVLDDRGLVLQVHPNFEPKLVMVASRISETVEPYDDWQDAIEHPCLASTPEALNLEQALRNAASLCEASPSSPDEFVILQRIPDRFIEWTSQIADKVGFDVTIDVNRVDEYTGAMIPVLVNDNTPADLHILEAVGQAYVTLAGTDILLYRMQ